MDVDIKKPKIGFDGNGKKKGFDVYKENEEK